MTMGVNRISMKLIMFGAKDQAEAKRLIMSGVGNKSNEPIVDATDRDFSIKGKASDDAS